MSPSRLSAGITSGSPADESSSANVASISCGSYGHAGMARGGRVHLLLQHPLVRRAHRVLRPAEHRSRRRARPRGTRTPRRSGRSGARSAPCGTRPRRRPRLHATRSRRTRRRRPCARSRSAHARRRSATTPGMRRARAHDHLAADLLAQDPVRRADVVARLGRHGRALQPEPVLADRRRGLVARPRSSVARRLASERSKRLNSSSSPITSGASTRRPSSSSSWPVWSPSRTTIVLSSRIGGQCSDRRSRTRPPDMAGDEKTEGAARRGWTRKGRKGAFRFVDQKGRVIRDEAAIERVREARDPARVEGRLDLADVRRRSSRRPATTRPAGSSTSTTRISARRRSRRSTTS